MAPPATDNLLIHRINTASCEDSDNQHNPDEPYKEPNKEVVEDNEGSKFVMATSDAITPSETVIQEIGTDYNFKRDIVWFNAIGFLMLHIAGVIGLYIMGVRLVEGEGHGAKVPTIIYFMLTTYLSGMGITMGAHRYFTHRSYKAKTWVKVALLWFHTMAGQNCLYIWVRDHRQHHKYSDTDADPHNANRGFFFSHVGWLMSRKHPKVLEYGKKIDMSDLEADPWVMFQKDYYKSLYMVFTLFLPTAIPCIFWNETIINSMFCTYFARYIVQLNFTWSVNSVAHIWGNKPYDKNILSVESMFVSFVAGGEGWHNYHHTFPWDYRTAELGMPFNLTTILIDFLAKFGQVYDRKTVSTAVLKARVLRTGDGSHEKYNHHHPEPEPDPETLNLKKYIVDKSNLEDSLKPISNGIDNNQNLIKSKN